MGKVQTIENMSIKKMPVEKVLVIEKLCKSFGDNHVLVDFDLELNKGENVAVLGKSGSGKSVLIKCIIGLLTPDRGRINVLGQNIDEMNIRELDEIRTKVGFLLGEKRMGKFH